MMTDRRTIPEYRAWTHMKTRCRNPNYPLYHRYGGRGIGICPAWLNSYEAFFRDMGPKPAANFSLDRIDNDGNYEPGNCRWTDARTQANNTSRNKHITAFGKTQTNAQWARELGIDWRVLWQRMVRDGKTLEQALVQTRKSPARKLS